MELGIKMLTQQHYRPQVFIRFRVCISLCLPCMTSLSFSRGMPREACVRSSSLRHLRSWQGEDTERLTSVLLPLSPIQTPVTLLHHPYAFLIRVFCFFFRQGIGTNFFQGMRHVKSWQLPSPPTTHREEFELREPVCNALYSFTPTVLWSTVGRQQAGLLKDFKETFLRNALILKLNKSRCTVYKVHCILWLHFFRINQSLITNLQKLWLHSAPCITPSVCANTEE